MKTWFSVKAMADSSGAEVNIFDDIGAWGVTAQDFIAALREHKGKPVTCLINSLGGSLFDALAMYNSLRANGAPVTVKIIGVAASAASLVAMAGDEIIMPENTYMMVHNPWAPAVGNAAELRDFADTLDTIGSSLVKTYAARTGMVEDDVKALLAAETWMTAADAKAKGFCTKVEPALKIAASFDADRLPGTVFSALTSANAATTTITETETETTTSEKVTVIETTDTASTDPANPDQAPQDTALIREIEALAAAAGVPDFAAYVALDKGVNSVIDAKAKLNVIRDVSSLCALVGKKDRAEEFIKNGFSLDQARSELLNSMARADEETRTNNHTRTEGSAQVSSGAQVWARVLPQTAAHR